MADDGQLGGRDGDRRDPPDRPHPAVRRALDRDEHGRLAVLVLEQLAREHPAGRPGAAGPGPGRWPAARPGRPATRPGYRRGRPPPRSPAARTAGTLRCSIAGAPGGGCSRLRSESTAALVCASSASSRSRCAAIRALRAGGVVGGEHRLDLADRHLQVPQAADDLRGRYLLGGVVAVAGARVHRGRRQQPHLVVVPQRLDAQVGDAGEVADREPCCHQAIVNPPVTGQSTAPAGLDPPATGAPRLESSAKKAQHEGVTS